MLIKVDLTQPEVGASRQGAEYRRERHEAKTLASRKFLEKAGLKALILIDKSFFKIIHGKLASGGRSGAS
ncbi:hypothetical protein [Pelotalea chapellei]|uniref:Uncharacterized protein n=1 Tax=Pelotalea chapellei TaxID=44671 RepID=A0ABS5UB22_9BACT|nr:hypothetical protein [Pelotalea chapellei]MBT1072888.1 hypothetical protein [Pelotalea chapellei]